MARPCLEEVTLGYSVRQVPLGSYRCAISLIPGWLICSGQSGPTHDYKQGNQSSLAHYGGPPFSGRGIRMICANGNGAGTVGRAQHALTLMFGPHIAGDALRRNATAVSAARWLTCANGLGSHSHDQSVVSRSLILGAVSFWAMVLSAVRGRAGAMLASTQRLSTAERRGSCAWAISVEASPAPSEKERAMPASGSPNGRSPCPSTD